MSFINPMVLINVIRLGFYRRFGVSLRTKASGNYSIVINSKNLELTIPYSAGFFLKERSTGNFLLMKCLIHEVPASKCGFVSFVFFLQLLYRMNYIQRLSPGSEHFSVRISFNFFFRYLSKRGEKRLS